MGAYITLCVSIIVVFIIIQGKNFKKVGIPLVLIFLALFFGLRDNLAIDDTSYMNIFKDVQLGNPVYIEQTFVIICKIVNNIFNMNYKLVFLLYAVLSFLFVYLIIKKLDIKKYEFWIFILSFIAFCFIPYLNAMRQFLASTIFIYSMLLFNEKKYLKTALLIIFAGLIHNSAYILIIFIPLFNNKMNISNKLKIAIPFLAIILGNTSIVETILTFVFQKLNISYIGYVTNASDTSLTNSGLLIYLLYFVYTIQYFFKVKSDDEYENFIEKGEMLFFVTFFITQGLGFTRRVSYFFMIFESFIFITLLRRTDNTKNKTNLIVLITIAIISFIAYGMSNSTLDMSFENFSLNFWK